MDNYEKFAEDMETQGIAWEPEYHGRNYYVGPAVRVSYGGDYDLQGIIRATTVELQWDQLGKGFIVYPVRRG